LLVQSRLGLLRRFRRRWWRRDETAVPSVGWGELGINRLSEIVVPKVVAGLFRDHGTTDAAGKQGDQKAASHRYVLGMGADFSQVWY
jgi:hypothetical protein